MLHYVSTCSWALYESCMTCIYYPRSNLAFEMTLEKMAQIAPNCEIYHLHKVKAFRQCVTKGVYDGLVC